MYAQITTEEITALAKVKASGLAVLVYSALSAHDWTRSDGVVFPSIKRLCKLLPGYHKSSIYKALKFLEDAGLIQRKEATSKSRFKLVMRAVKEKAIEAVKALSPYGESSGESSCKRREMKRIKKTSFSSKRRRGKKGKIVNQNWKHPEHQELTSSGSALEWVCSAVYWISNGCRADSMPAHPSADMPAIKRALTMDMWGFKEHRGQILKLAEEVL